MEKQATISNEQKAHDLAIAYITYLSCSRNEEIDVEPFYQDYENAYAAFLPLVEHNH